MAITSDEKESTVFNALKLLLEVLPGKAFYGRKEGPEIVMTDDSSTEREALSKIWPNARLLLCIFHFLQGHWTRLHDGKNKIKNEHRAVLIGKVKELVYCKSEKDLNAAYTNLLVDDLVKPNPNLKHRLESYWPRRKECALCYRSKILTRGNNTNNISESGIKIVKELIFGRIKAYNLVQMFQFVTEAFETYIKRRLLIIAHNRFDSYISSKYKGLLAEKIDKSSIIVLNFSKKMFTVKSSKTK